MQRRLIGIANPGELLDFTGKSLLVHSLYVPVDTNVQRCGQVHFNKMLGLRTNFVTDRSIRRNRRRNGHGAMLTQQRTNKSNPADVFVTVFLTEAEPFSEVRADNVAIENLDASASPHEFFADQ